MGKRNFEDLIIWQDGKVLAVDIFKMWKRIDNRGYFSLQDQMQRSAVSIPSNIAEGSERKSAAEFIRYLYIAKGSAAELRTQLLIFDELEISDGINVPVLIERTLKLSKQISRLISSISEGKK